MRPCIAPKQKCQRTVSNTHPPLQTSNRRGVKDVADHAVCLDLVEPTARATGDDTGCILTTAMSVATTRCALPMVPPRHGRPLMPFPRFARLIVYRLSVSVRKAYRCWSSERPSALLVSFYIFKSSVWSRRTFRHQHQRSESPTGPAAGDQEHHTLRMSQLMSPNPYALGCITAAGDSQLELDSLFESYKCERGVIVWVFHHAYNLKENKSRDLQNAFLPNGPTFVSSSKAALCCRWKFLTI